MTYEKFYDDYERGTWFIAPVDDKDYIRPDILVDGLTGPQADAIVAALNAARALADELGVALLVYQDYCESDLRAYGSQSHVDDARAALAKWEASK